MGEKWSTVQIPDALKKEVEKLVKDSKRYTNPTDFIKDAVRRRLEELEKEVKED